MIWPSDPFTYLGLINVATGLFSASVGLFAALTTKAPFEFQAGNPWLYVLGGLLTALIGVGNWFQWSLAAWGTLLFITLSAYDGWFGSGSKDWRIYTLTTYVFIQSALLIWSVQYRSPFTLP